MSNSVINGLYYITHIDNLASILQKGILSHEEMEKRNIPFMPIYNEQIVQYRQKRYLSEGYNLWYYANLYFQPRNPMLYQLVVGKNKLDELIILKLRKQVLELPNILLSDGNAAHSMSQITNYNIDLLEIIKKQIDIQYWKDNDGSKRKIMAECLVPCNIPPDYIDSIYVGKNNGIFYRAQEILKATGYSALNVISQPSLFFQPENKYRVTDNLFLAEGDLFFSRMQTLTISVNTVGVMGKGLASRAKYQFPEVYVYYQDLCKHKKLRTNLPALIKTETSLTAELSEFFNENISVYPANWFLLFATKQHWREDSKIDYIIDGLQWLKNNYKKQGITSLALPALGCGLGNLKWAEVGPLMCSMLKDIEISTCIYLPTEKKLSPEELSRDYLLRK